MAVSYVQLQDHATLIMGEEFDPRIDLNSIINEAGEYLFSTHNWAWRSRPPASLNAVADQSWIALPMDFGLGEILGLVTSEMTTSVNLVTADTVQHHRKNSAQSPHSYWAGVVFPAQESLQEPLGNPRLEIYPTPTSDTDDFMKLSYRAGWVRLGPQQATNANVPHSFDNMLVQFVRAFARYYASGDRSDIEAIEQSRQLGRLKRADTLIEPHLGRIRGGILSGDSRIDPLWNFTTVAPS